MELRLKQCREATGLTQKEVAQRLEIKLATYRTWEQGTVGITLKNAVNVSRVIGCTPNDIAGWPKEKGGRAFVDERQADVNEWYEGCSDSQRSFIAQSARNAYESEKKSESVVYTDKREAV